MRARRPIPRAARSIPNREATQGLGVSNVVDGPPLLKATMSSRDLIFDTSKKSIFGISVPKSIAAKIPR
jgi:hypothetical protein